MNINSVSDLINALNTLAEPKEGYTRFFRGHSNEIYELKPSIYRKESYIANEENIIRDAIVNCPNEFPEKESLFSSLVTLQHYGYPTRLLDLTNNALVALYFAVCNEENNGEIIILDIPNEYIKYFDSDTVSILSAISLRKYELSIEYSFLKFAEMIAKIDFLESLKDVAIYGKSITTALNKCNIINQRKYLIKLLNKKVNIKDIDSYINNTEKDIDKAIEESELEAPDIEDLSRYKFSEHIKYFNKQTDIAKLLDDIRKEKPSFRPFITKDDLEKVICVKSKLNNDRIARQQGCFLLFGINTEKKNLAEFNDDWVRKDPNGKKFIIPQKSKGIILKELNTFGINKKTLFPELESQKDDILAKYGK